MTDHLLTIAEAADRLRLSVRTVHRLLERGELAAVGVRTVRGRRIAASALDALLVARGGAVAASPEWDAFMASSFDGWRSNGTGRRGTREPRQTQRGRRAG